MLLCSSWPWRKKLSSGGSSGNALFLHTLLHLKLSYCFISIMFHTQLLWAGWFYSFRSQHDDKMTQFFKNNFSEDRWRKAALKNAFSLLGKQRFEQSAAFFLLAGSLKDAIEVWTHMCKLKSTHNTQTAFHCWVCSKLCIALFYGNTTKSVKVCLCELSQYIPKSVDIC